MPVTVKIFAKIARNKPGTLLKYEHLSEVLQTLNLDNKKPFFGRSFYIVTASVYVYIYIYIYIRQVSKRSFPGPLRRRSTCWQCVM